MARLVRARRAHRPLADQGAFGRRARRHRGPAKTPGGARRAAGARLTVVAAVHFTTAWAVALQLARWRRRTPDAPPPAVMIDLRPRGCSASAAARGRAGPQMTEAQPVPTPDIADAGSDLDPDASNAGRANAGASPVASIRWRRPSLQQTAQEIKPDIPPPPASPSKESPGPAERGQRREATLAPPLPPSPKTEGPTMSRPPRRMRRNARSRSIRQAQAPPDHGYFQVRLPPARTQPRPLRQARALPLGFAGDLEERVDGSPEPLQTLSIRLPAQEPPRSPSPSPGRAKCCPLT